MERQEFRCEGSPYQTHKNLIRYNHKAISASDFPSKEAAKFGGSSHQNQDMHIHIDNYISTENNINTNGVDAILTDAIQPKCDEYLTPRSSIGLRSPVPFHDENRLKVSTENRLTRISLGIVYLFIFCHIWRLIPTVYEALFSEDGTVLSNWPKWLFHVYHLSHTLIVFNSAANFILYVVG